MTTPTVLEWTPLPNGMVISNNPALTPQPITVEQQSQYQANPSAGIPSVDAAIHAAEGPNAVSPDATPVAPTPASTPAAPSAVATVTPVAPTPASEPTSEPAPSVALSTAQHAHAGGLLQEIENGVHWVDEKAKAAFLTLAAWLHHART